MSEDVAGLRAALERIAALEPIGPFRVATDELAAAQAIARAALAALSSPETTPAGVLDEAALAHLRQHVTFEDVGTPNLSMRMDSYCPEHPRPPETLGQYQLVAPDENRHLLEAFAAVIAPDSLAAALGRSGSGGGRG